MEPLSRLPEWIDYKQVNLSASPQVVLETIVGHPKYSRAEPTLVGCLSSN
jgi:hypothetical protein